MKTILVIAFSDLSRDPRVNRQLNFINEKYKVIVVGLKAPSLSEVEYVHVAKKKKSIFGILIGAMKLLTGEYESYYWQNSHVKETWQKVSNIPKDLVLANDIETLPLALKIAGKAKVILDAHEYAPGQNDSSFIWRIFFKKYMEYLSAKYIPKAYKMITVCKGIAEQYEKETGVRSIVINNAPYYQEIEPLLLKNDNNCIRMIHHGGASPSRKLEKLIQVMSHLDDRFELSLMLIDSTNGYIKHLKKLAKRKENIKFLDPVPMSQIAVQLNRYDIGIYILEPNSFNQCYSLPNKLFEFIQARLAVAIGPSPEMAAVVNKFDCGIVTNDFSSLTMAKCLNEISIEKINYYKKQSHKAAKVLNADHNKGLFLNYIEQVLKD